LLREYTKRYEQQVLGTAPEVARQLPEPVRGEIVLVIAPSQPSPTACGVDAADLDEEIDALLRQGQSVSAVAKSLAERGLGERRHVYARAALRKRAQRDTSLPQR
jgi:16S rRNA (cytidine1402-2'-O)-methyltransferase